MKIKENLIDKIDYWLILPVIGLVIFGLLSLKSSTSENLLASGNFNKQVVFIIISLVVFFIFAFIPSRLFRLFSIPFYVISLLSLVLVLILGRTVSGAKSWIDFGLIGFQPAELSKLAYVLFMSFWLSKKNVDINQPKYLAITTLFSIIPIFLILAEPDLGTVIIYSILFIGYLFWAGINIFGLFVIISPPLILFISFFGTFAMMIGLILIIIALFYFRKDVFVSLSIFISNIAGILLFEFAIKLLRPHQQQRILTFLNPAADPLGSGYNALQAQIAIGSGGLFGRGFMEGTQTQLRFIPEQWTDFIFSVIGEEFGFLGSIIVVILFAIIFFRLLTLAQKLKNRFESFVTLGVLLTLFFHFLINIGMNIGLAPIIGIPLPFISYGGTAFLTYSAMMGLIISFYRTNNEHV